MTPRQPVSSIRERKKLKERLSRIRTHDLDDPVYYANQWTTEDLLHGDLHRCWPRE